MTAIPELSPPTERAGTAISAPSVQPDLPGMAAAFPETPTDDAAEERTRGVDWGRPSKAGGAQ